MKYRIINPGTQAWRLENEKNKAMNLYVGPVVLIFALVVISYGLGSHAYGPSLGPTAAVAPRYAPHFAAAPRHTSRYAPHVAAAPRSDVVPFSMINQAMHVTVNVGGASVDMAVDTGAGITQITESFANNLLAYGQAREVTPSITTIADGSSRIERRIIVSSLTLGSHTCTNVLMVVAPDRAMMLLGLPVLNSIGKFTIDANNSRLIFG